MQDKKLVTTTKKQNNTSTGKQTRTAQNPHARRVQMGFTLAAFIILNALARIGKGILAALKGLFPAIDRSAGRRFSRTAHLIFAIITLESPRLMLISRYRAARMERSKKVGISAAGGSAIVMIVLATILVGSQLFAITVNGKVIGYVSDEGQYVSLIQRAKEKISAQIGTENTEILIQDKNVTLNAVIAPQQQPLVPVTDASSDTVQAGDSAGIFGTFGGSSDSAGGEEALADLFVDTLINDGAVQATLYTITINGRQMATLGTLNEASDVLQTIADNFTPSGGQYTGKFTDEVAINGIATGLDGVKLQKPDDVIAYLLRGTTTEKTYTAVEEDTIENICAALGVMEQELYAEYPEYDFEKIRAGDVFSTTLNIPYVHYKVEGVETTNDPIPYETVEEKSSDLFLGQRETKESGQLGERKVTRQVTRINGELVTASEIESEVIKEPVNETVLIGTKMVRMGNAYVGPSDGTGGGGNGPLGRPLNSWYLSRGVGGAHQGDDMLAPLGTPIFAAESGTVIVAEYRGGYGNLVIIDHGNGLQTYYAHCDTFNVTAGSTVQRGQQIATVGITGRATAYHLHFEVRVNGVVQEPLNWIG